MRKDDNEAFAPHDDDDEHPSIEGNDFPAPPMLRPFSDNIGILRQSDAFCCWAVLLIFYF